MNKQRTGHRKLHVTRMDKRHQKQMWRIYNLEIHTIVLKEV